VPGAQGVHRVADLLRAIASHDAAGARLLDLARQCRLEPPTTHRLLKALDAEGLVARDPSARTYTLGPLTFELGLAAAHHFRARDLCAQALQAIAEHTGDTVFLSMRSGLDTVCIDRREGRFPIKTLTLDVGTRRPLGLGAGGLALLAALDDAEIDAVLGANAWRLAAYGGMRAPVLLDMVRPRHPGGTGGARARDQRRCHCEPHAAGAAARNRKDRARRDPVAVHVAAATSALTCRAGRRARADRDPRGCRVTSA
jgi:DNA-binding IclR family transcriptional regulator